METIKPLILYHSNCADGLCSAYFFRRAFPFAEFKAVKYGQKAPDVFDREVYILDFCYPFDDLLFMGACASRLTVIDHHKTSFESVFSRTSEFTKNVSLVFDLSKSGGRLSWEYLCRQGLIDPDPFSCLTAPWLVDYTEDRDLWRWKLAFSREINSAIRSFAFTFEEWDKLYLEYSEPGPLVSQGTAILRAEKLMVDSHLPFAKEVILGDTKGLCVNATVLQSEIAHELAKKASFGACYVSMFDGSRSWSLRSIEGGSDVSEIAKQFGGGGHKHAAGFIQKL